MRQHYPFAIFDGRIKPQIPTYIDRDHPLSRDLLVAVLFDGTRDNLINYASENILSWTSTVSRPAAGVYGPAIVNTDGVGLATINTGIVPPNAANTVIAIVRFYDSGTFPNRIAGVTSAQFNLLAPLTFAGDDYIRMDDGGSFITQYVAGASPSAWRNTWHHMAYRYDASSSAIFEDNILKVTGAGYAPTFGAATITVLASASIAGSYYIESLWWWGRALSDNEIRTHYAQPYAMFGPESFYLSPSGLATVVSEREGGWNRPTFPEGRDHAQVAGLSTLQAGYGLTGGGVLTPQPSTIPFALDSAVAAPLASPTFTGDPKAPTPSPGDNDTSIATTAFVQAEIDAQRYRMPVFAQDGTAVLDANGELVYTLRALE